jgi:hypothetical protein
MHRPVIIIGAPRSGTNMLRDVLTRVPGHATWPCDEINLMWRHGHRDHPSDELPAEFATPKVARYLRRQFSRLQRKHDARVVVEKTCANSLRVPYVDRCMPNARFLFITRDGMDAVASAMQRWHAPFDLGYTARKVLYVPPSDLPYYGARFVGSRLKGRHDPQSATGVQSWWGPKLDGQAALMREHPLDELAALQWQRCVDASTKAFTSMEAGRVHQLSYEEFVADPTAGLTRILEFLGEDVTVDPAWVSGVSVGSVGKGRAKLGEERVGRLTELVRPTQERLGHA